MARAIYLAALLTLAAAAQAGAQTPFIVGVPDFPVAVPGVELGAWPWGEKDWPTRRCENLSRELRDSESRILELKVRYWAARLSAGSTIALSSNPGSEIRDKQLRREFYRRLGLRLETASAHWVFREEIKSLRAAMRGQWTLIKSCGGEDEELRRAYEQIVVP